MSLSPFIKRLVYPYLIISQTIPLIAVAPLLIVWFGYGLLPKIIIVILVCFFPITVSLIEGFSLWHQLQNTVIFITHDIEEAILLSDKVVVLSQRPGQILKEIPIPFERPRDLDILLTPSAQSLKKELFSLLLHSSISI